MADLSFYRRKNVHKTAEMSGKRAKIGHFTYRKQNSIAEIVSTMESFLVQEMGLERHTSFAVHGNNYMSLLLRFSSQNMDFGFKSSLFYMQSKKIKSLHKGVNSLFGAGDGT